MPILVAGKGAVSILILPLLSFLLGERGPLYVGPSVLVFDYSGGPLVSSFACLVPPGGSVLELFPFYVAILTSGSYFLLSLAFVLLLVYLALLPLSL